MPYVEPLLTELVQGAGEIRQADAFRKVRVELLAGFGELARMAVKVAQALKIPAGDGDGDVQVLMCWGFGRGFDDGGAEAVRQFDGLSRAHGFWLRFGLYRSAQRVQLRTACEVG